MTMVELNEKGVEAARDAIWNTDSPEYARDYLMYDHILEAGIRAYLSALPAPDDGLVDETDRDMIARGDRIGADLVRALLLHYDRANTLVRSQIAQIERLTHLADEQERILNLMAKDWFDFCEMMGVTPDTQEAVAYALQARLSNADHDKRAAEQQVQKLTAEVERLREALEAAAIALDEAAIEVQSWGAYASEYFQDKHDLEGCCDEIAKQARDARSALETQEGGK